MARTYSSSFHSWSGWPLSPGRAIPLWCSWDARIVPMDPTKACSFRWLSSFFWGYWAVLMRGSSRKGWRMHCSAFLTVSPSWEWKAEKHCQKHGWICYINQSMMIATRIYWPEEIPCPLSTQALWLQHAPQKAHSVMRNKHQALVHIWLFYLADANGYFSVLLRRAPVFQCFSSEPLPNPTRFQKRLPFSCQCPSPRGQWHHFWLFDCLTSASQQSCSKHKGLKVQPPNVVRKEKLLCFALEACERLRYAFIRIVCNGLFEALHKILDFLRSFEVIESLSFVQDQAWIISRFVATWRKLFWLNTAWQHCKLLQQNALSALWHAGFHWRWLQKHSLAFGSFESNFTEDSEKPKPCGFCFSTNLFLVARTPNFKGRLFNRSFHWKTLSIDLFLHGVFHQDSGWHVHSAERPDSGG